MRAKVVDALTNRILEFAISEWNNLQGAKVLDYGCGIMPYAKAFELAGAEVVGADIAGNAEAQVTIPPAGPLPLADSGFDFVVSFQVLEHVPLPQLYLSEALRVLKPGGKIFLTTHGTWPYHPTPGDYRRWTVEGLALELTQAGFRELEIKPILNEYSAGIQSLAMTAEYHGAYRPLLPLTHFLTHILINILENIVSTKPQIPGVICIKGLKK
jgi:SAM-dependent methyltransferase